MVLENEANSNGGGETTSKKAAKKQAKDALKAAKVK